MEVDAEGIQVRTVPITLLTGVPLDLEIRFEVLQEYCEDCHWLGHKKGECWVANVGAKEGQHAKQQAKGSHLLD